MASILSAEYLLEVYPEGQAISKATVRDALAQAGSEITQLQDAAGDHSGRIHGLEAIVETAQSHVAVAEADVNVVADASRLNFTGSGIQVTAGAGGQVDINVPGALGAANTLEGLSDTQISLPGDNHALLYDATLAKWKSVPTAPAYGQMTMAVNQPAIGQLPFTLSAPFDFTITSIHHRGIGGGGSFSLLHEGAAIPGLVSINLTTSAAENTPDNPHTVTAGETVSLNLLGVDGGASDFWFSLNLTRGA